MKKLLLLLSLCLVATVSQARVYIGCHHGRWFVAEYSSEGGLTHWQSGNGGPCAGVIWEIHKMAMAPGSLIPTGIPTNPAYEQLIDGTSPADYIVPNQNDPEFIAITALIEESLANSQPLGTSWINLDNINQETRNFLVTLH